ncbi:hypothetical protein LCGC14_1496890 [marine sediment metagenome]|uniref:Uncharacterized protein n=1 Tax=marine sediment metagenome TaxID=412755 RepID=A0A0F9J5T2_9ZZZZ
MIWLLWVIGVLCVVVGLGLPLVSICVGIAKEWRKHP